MQIHHIRNKTLRLWQAGAAAVTTATTCFQYTTLITFPSTFMETLFGNCLKQGNDMEREEERGEK